MKVEYGCRICIALAEARGLKEWPLYPREQVVRKGHGYFCLKHATRNNKK